MLSVLTRLGGEMQQWSYEYEGDIAVAQVGAEERNFGSKCDIWGDKLAIVSKCDVRRDKLSLCAQTQVLAATIPQHAQEG